MTTSTPTPVLPARDPDGWWTGHTRYRNYVLFAATGMVLTLVNVVMLWAVSSLAGGTEAWTAFLAFFAGPIGLALTAFLLVGTLFFAIRYLRVGAKIPAVRLGPLPAPGTAMILVLHFAGFVSVTLAVLLAFSGVIL